MIARRLAEGQSLKQIAIGLRRHRRTVGDHVQDLKRRTGSRTLPELVFRLATGRVGTARVGALVCEFARRHRLTAMQATTIGLLVRGNTIRGIARHLGRSRSSAKTQLDTARHKAGAASCLELASAIASSNGSAG